MSNNGRVRNIKTKRELALVVGSTGYHKVGLYKNGKRTHISVHILVAKAFIDNPENKPQVNHIDGIKTNNSVENLEWVTAFENTMHAFNTGLRRGSDHNKGKKLGKTSKYHYVLKVNSKKDGVIYRALVKKEMKDGKIFQKIKQFSVKKYGANEAEKMAAIAANELVESYKEFEGLAKNDIA